MIHLSKHTEIGEVMGFSQRFSNLPGHTFTRLRALLNPHEPGSSPINMSLGEPKHPMPDFLAEVLAEHLDGFATYPPNNGSTELLDSINRWIALRFGVKITNDQLMVLNGTREGLYNIAMALLPKTENPVVLVPNPCYQAYMVGALSVGAQPVFLSARAETGFLPDYDSVSPEILNRTTAAFICSPSNPQGAVASWDYLANLLRLAEKYNFFVFADECYSDIYRDTIPTGLLQVAQDIGADPEKVFVFNSLSKRSNLPGLRSGFIAGGIEGIKYARQLRAYAGSPSPLPLQQVAAKAWSDEQHVIDNRTRYREKYKIADQLFDGLPGYKRPEAGLFLWLPVENSAASALELWRKAGVRVLPGSYLTHDDGSSDFSQDYIRVAIVESPEQVRRGLNVIRNSIF